MSDNPFPISLYRAPEYFCNRNKESDKLIKSLQNGRNTVLISIRRMGKSSLIKHVFHNVETNRQANTIYLDIMNTNSVAEFVNHFAAAMLASQPKNSKRLFNRLLKLFTSFSPTITLDPVSGLPSIGLKLHTQSEEQASLNQIFTYLESLDKPVYIGIDEFQQVTHYADKSFVAFLRSKIQLLSNVNFIFSGSEQRILTDMFNSVSAPFYQSADYLHLDRIDKNTYAQFIVEHFEKTKRVINYNQVNEVLEWLDVYTFYVQSFFNKLWYTGSKTIRDEDIETVKRQIIMERDYVYSGLKKLVTSGQFDLLKAIALSNGIVQPTGKKFINQFNLGTTSTVSSSLKALIEKQLIYYENQSYKVYDVFLAKWFQLIF